MIVAELPYHTLRSYELAHGHILLMLHLHAVWHMSIVGDPTALFNWEFFWLHALIINLLLRRYSLLIRSMSHDSTR